MAQTQRALHTLHFVQGKCHELMLGIDCAAVCCSALQCVAVRCAMALAYHKLETHLFVQGKCHILMLQVDCVAVCCSVLQCVALWPWCIVHWRRIICGGRKVLQ